MKEFQVSGYTPMSYMEEPVWTIIEIVGDIAYAGNKDEPIERWAEIFDAQAEILFTALRDSLPGGTIDRLTGKLLAYKASHFHVNHECHQPKQENHEQ